MTGQGAQGKPRFLILKPCCIGDALLASPLVEAIKRRWPESVVDWASDTHTAPVVRGIPGVADRVPAEGTVPGAYSLSGLLKLVTLIRARQYGTVLIPDRSPVLGAAAALARAPERIGLDSGGRGLFHTHRVPVTPGGHEAELYAGLLSHLGIEPDATLRPRFRPSASDRATALTLLPGDGRRRVAVHPGGGVNPGMTLAEKRWPADRYADVVEWLVKEKGIQVLILGAASDRDAVEALLAALPEDLARAARPEEGDQASPIGNSDSAHRSETADSENNSVRAANTELTPFPRTTSPVMDLSELLDLSLSGAVIERCELFVGNDSGMAHLATAVGTPAVVVFGPTDPDRYGPLPGLGVAVGPSATHFSEPRASHGRRVIEQVTVQAVQSAIAEQSARRTQDT